MGLRFGCILVFAKGQCKKIMFVLLIYLIECIAEKMFTTYKDVSFKHSVLALPPGY